MNKYIRYLLYLMLFIASVLFFPLGIFLLGYFVGKKRKWNLKTEVIKEESIQDSDNQSEVIEI